MDLYDVIRVDGSTAEAARSVGDRVTKKASGAVAEVVAEVEEWPLLLASPGEELW
jgi:hypothetical protein